MTVLVTGASGHVSAHLIPLLIRENHSVRAFVRESSNLAGISHLDIDVHRGDVLDAASLRQAMDGCDAVFHLAAPTQAVRGLEDAIISGTENVLFLAEKCGVSALVYTSSIVTVGYSTDPRIALDESTRSMSSATPYHRAKYVAEGIALERARKVDFRLVIVNPTTVIGSMDYRVTPSSEAIQRAIRRRLPFTFDSGLTIAPVRNVASGHLLALLHGRSGERYILGGDRLTIPDYFRLIEECCGRRTPHLFLPRSVMLGIGMAGSVLSFLGQDKVPFTFTQARQLVGKYGYYSSEKAVRELGYRWQPAKYAIADYIEWVRAGRPSSVDAD